MPSVGEWALGTLLPFGPNRADDRKGRFAAWPNFGIVNYFGAALNRAVRIMATAHGVQILLSAAVTAFGLLESRESRPTAGRD